MCVDCDAAPVQAFVVGPHPPCIAPHHPREPSRPDGTDGVAVRQPDLPDDDSEDRQDPNGGAGTPKEQFTSTRTIRM